MTRFPFDKKEKFKKAIASWLNSFNKTKKEHRNKLSQVLNLYVNAFDEKDKQTCFLKSWITLESLLGTHENQLIINRCSAIFKVGDREYQKEILKGLRIRRNLIVHENDNRINLLVNCYHVQRYIKGILRLNNLKYRNIIKNNEEAIKLLDYRLKSMRLLESELKVLNEVTRIKKNES